MIYSSALTLCFIYMSSLAVAPQADVSGEPPPSGAKEPVPDPSPAIDSVLAIQPFLSTQEVSLKTAEGTFDIKLANLNARINAWYLLESSQFKDVYHLENPYPYKQTISLAPASGHLIVSAPGKTEVCNFFDKAVQDKIKKERDENRSFSEVCQGTIYVRNPIEGRQTAKEFVTDFFPKSSRWK